MSANDLGKLFNSNVIISFVGNLLYFFSRYWPWRGLRQWYIH